MPRQQGRTLAALYAAPRLRAVEDPQPRAVGLAPRDLRAAAGAVLRARRGQREVAVGQRRQRLLDRERQGSVLQQPLDHARIELAWRAEGPISPAARALIDHARATLTPSRRP